MSRRKEYCSELEKYTAGIDHWPMITISTDGKGVIAIFADKILSHEQKAQLMLDGFKTLLEGVIDEETRIKMAKILKPHEYRKAD